ncbi:Cyclin-P3-1 [Dichanthelium oligosanthes]|uniref:Cyclin-P3-1 n=1 Tax=Dichanthelium oligosanthes TaxID=888268 RepID=A0A1E5WB44_9POAL|nr:Cyclin-P3-1 [Dichanthelium oligosanthes]
MAMEPPTTDAGDELESYSSLGLTVPHSLKDNAEFPKVLLLLSVYLDKTVKQNEELLDSRKIKESATIFHGQRVPELSIKLYAERIFKYAQCSPSCFVLGLIYMERYLQQPNIYMTSFSVHRMLITSVVVAAKFIDDSCFNNAYYGRVGGISTREMNRLELDLLFSLDFRLKVNLETFRSYCLQLEKGALALVLERPIQVQATNGTKPLICNSSVDETCKHELVRGRYSSQALQGCSW